MKTNNPVDKALKHIIRCQVFEYYSAHVFVDDTLNTDMMTRALFLYKRNTEIK